MMDLGVPPLGVTAAEDTSQCTQDTPAGKKRFQQGRTQIRVKLTLTTYFSYRYIKFFRKFSSHYFRMVLTQSEAKLAYAHTLDNVLGEADYTHFKSSLDKEGIDDIFQLIY
jgi:hypothetical protein